MMAVMLSPEVRGVIESGRLGHFTTIAKDAAPTRRSCGWGSTMTRS